MNAQVKSALAAIAPHRFWIELGALGLIAIGAAYFTGKSAYAKAAVLRAEAESLSGTRVLEDKWLSSFQPASSAEAQTWDEAQRETQRMGVGASDRLTLAEVIARRAERSGLGTVRVRFTGDSLPALPRQPAPPHTFNVAPYTIKVDFTGTLRNTQSFLGMLPPAVALRRLDMSRGSGYFGSTLVLSVYEVNQ